MNKSESIKELAAALAKAQASFPTIPRDKTVKVRTRTGGEYTFAYAPLETILAAIRKPLSDNGLSVLQEVRDEKVVTTILHSSGEFYSSGGTPIKVSEQGAQAYGSGLTYSRRYDLTLLLNLCADDDDDGNGAEGNSVQRTTKGGKPKADPLPFGAITPTTDAFKGIPPAREQMLHDIASEAIEMLEAGALEECYKLLYEEYLDARKIDNDEFVALWSLLGGHSKGRNALKRMRQERTGKLAETA